MSISQSALSTAYPALMHFFTVDAATIQWLTTGFMLMMYVMMPVSPWLLNNISFKHLYLSVLALFGVGTLMIIFAPTFWLALLGRLLEATAVGILFPSFQTVLMTITPKDKRGQTMGAAGLVSLSCWPDHLWDRLKFFALARSLLAILLFNARDLFGRLCNEQ